MPVEFLSDEQAARYGRYTGDPTPEQLTRFFYLNEHDQALIAARRRDHNKLGFAVQLCTLRFLGTFLPNPLQVPAVVVRHVADQLQLAPEVFPKYLGREETRYHHRQLILAHLDYRDFDGYQAFRLTRWLYAQVATSTLRPSILFDLATAHLVAGRVVLPGVSVLARLIARVRERLSGRTFEGLSVRLSPEQRVRLETLLRLPQGERLTPLEVLRTSPTRVTAPALHAAVLRIEHIREVGVGHVEVSDVPEARRALLARHAQTVWAQTLLRMSESRRLATLLLFVQHLERTATDDVLDLFDGLMTSLVLKGTVKHRRERLRSLKDLDQAALVLQDAVRVLLDEAVAETDVRQTVFARIGATRLREAVSTVRELASEDDDPTPEALSGSYTTVRRFLPALLRTVEFQGTPSARPLLDAWRFLLRQEQGGRGRPKWTDAPRTFVPKVWERRVFPARGEVDHQAYTLCVLDRLQQALKRREVFAPHSERYGDPRAELLQGAAWEAARDDVARALGRSLDPRAELDLLRVELGAAYREVEENLAANTALKLEMRDGHTQVTLTSLEAQPDPPSLVHLREQVNLRLPQVELAALLLEIHAFTGFADAFTHVTDGRARVGDLPLSLCAVLLAQSCNIGLKAVSRPDVPALALSRLSWVQQNYVRAETITAANARLLIFAQVSNDAEKGVPRMKARGSPLRRIRCHPTVNRFFNASTDVAQKLPTTFRLRSAQINSIGFSSGA